MGSIAMHSPPQITLFCSDINRVAKFKLSWWGLCQDRCSGISPVQTQLLHCCAGRPPGGHTTAVHQSPSHSCTNNSESLSEWSHHADTAVSSLAPDPRTHQIQTMSNDAQHSQQPQSVLREWYGHPMLCTASFDQHQIFHLPWSAQDWSLVTVHSVSQDRTPGMTYTCQSPFFAQYSVV
jgi:hypothetical protein